MLMNAKIEYENKKMKHLKKKRKAVKLGIDIWEEINMWMLRISNMNIDDISKREFDFKIEISNLS